MIHITLATGATRLSLRSEVSPRAIDAVRQALALNNGVITGTGWTVDLIPTPEDAHVYRLACDGMAVATCFLATTQDVADALWQRAMQIGGLPGTINHQPETVPWLAVALTLDERIDRDPMRFANILAEAGDLERVVAWTLVD